MVSALGLLFQVVLYLPRSLLLLIASGLALGSLPLLDFVFFLICFFLAVSFLPPSDATTSWGSADE